MVDRSIRDGRHSAQSSGARRRELCVELPPRKPSWPAVIATAFIRPDIWMQAIRSDALVYLASRGPSTYGLLRRVAPRNDDHYYAASARRKPFHIAVAEPDNSTRT